MKYFWLSITFLFLNCKEFGGEIKQEIELNSPKKDSITAEKNEIPKGAITADFLGNQDSLYAFVKNHDSANETTIIGFQNNILPDIIIPESIGSDLHVLKLKNFQADILLVNAKLKDTNFNEYYLFVWQDSIWKQPVNRFNIHKSNMSDTLIPISNNPKDSTQLLRYYSVFEMDGESEKKFTWKLMTENVSINE